MLRAARCWSSWTTSGVAALAALAALVLAGCGATSSGPWHATFASHGSGIAQYWTVRADGKPKAVVVVLHGLTQDSGEQLQAWQRHLAAEGFDVIFPRYEEPPGNADARDAIVQATRSGLDELGKPDAPLVLLGHSRGGRLAVEAAAFLHPRLVIAFYPGRINPAVEPDTNFRLIPRTTDIWLFVGDRDVGVGPEGVLQLNSRLAADDFPIGQLHEDVIRSSQGFVADHMSVYRSTPAARRAIWARTDRIIHGVL